MDPKTHKEFLEYRARHGYFGTGKAVLSFDDWRKADAEQRALADLGDKRTDEDEVRFQELNALLFLD